MKSSAIRVRELGILLVGVVWLAWGGARTAIAQCELADVAIAPVDHTRIGVDIAIEDGYAVVGNAQDDSVDVYRLERATWVPDTRIEGPVGAGFGASVALEGGWLAVGATAAEGGRGRVYLYRLVEGQWVQRDVLVTPGAPNNSQFGLAIEAHESRVVVLENSGDGTTDVHVFRRLASDAWVYESTLERVPLRWGGLTSSISADGRTLVLSPVSSGGPFNTQVYERTAASWVRTLRVNTVGSAAVRGDLLAIGIDEPGARWGLQLFRRDGMSWIPTEVLRPAVGPVPSFGSIVALGENEILAGSYETLYAFRRDGETWSEAIQLAEVTGFLTDTEIDSGVGIAYATDGHFRSWDLTSDDCTTLCRGGSVNAIDGAVDTLFLNGSVGDAAREITIGATDSWLLWMLRPPAGGNGAFLVHANLGAPTATDPVVLPDALGLVCFTPFLAAGASPAAIWNGVGRPGRFGASRYFDGAPMPDPAPAPAFLLQLDEGDPANLPPGTVVTFQGILRDPAALGTRGFAPTNAIVIRVE